MPTRPTPGQPADVPELSKSVYVTKIRLAFVGSTVIHDLSRKGAGAGLTTAAIGVPQLSPPWGDFETEIPCPRVG